MRGATHICTSFGRKRTSYRRRSSSIAGVNTPIEIASWRCRFGHRYCKPAQPNTWRGLKAALYFYFPAKAQLLKSLAHPFLDEVRALLDAYPDGPDGPLAAPARREVVCALTDLLLAHRPIVAWLTRDLTALARPEIGERVADNADRLQRLLAGSDTDAAGQVRAAAALGALMRPIAALPDLDLAALRDTLVAVALALLDAE